jgi:hypothetical protein
MRGWLPAPDDVLAGPSGRDLRSAVQRAGAAGGPGRLGLRMWPPRLACAGMVPSSARRPACIRSGTRLERDRDRDGPGWSAIPL